MADRYRQLVFTISLLALCWLAMMAVHELGHVLGAVVSGGSVERVVLHPFAISRTDVSPNPHPGIVVWLGPVIGCLFPLAFSALLPARFERLRNLTKFFSGFCLVANGAYIAIGSFEGIGDGGVMLSTGAPRWSLMAFGATTVPLGLYLWHQIGSLGYFLSRPSLVGQRLAYTTAVFCVLVVGVELWLSSW